MLTWKIAVFCVYESGNSVLLEYWWFQPDTCLPALTRQTGYRLRCLSCLVYSRFSAEVRHRSEGAVFGVCLPKRYAETGRASLS